MGSVFGYASRWEVYRDWADAKAAVGLTNFTPHDARHTYATWLRRYGKVDLRGLMDIVGWRDHKSTIRYAHVVSDEQRQAVDLLPMRGKSVESRRRRKKNVV